MTEQPGDAKLYALAVDELNAWFKQMRGTLIVDEIKAYRVIKPLPLTSSFSYTTRSTEDLTWEEIMEASYSRRVQSWDELCKLQEPDSDFEMIVHCLRSFILVHPDSAILRCFYARALWAYLRFDDALTELHDARKLQPHNWLVQSLYGETLMLKRDYTEALHVLSTVIAMTPNSARTWVARGLAYQHMAEGVTLFYEKASHYQQALYDYQKALELLPASKARYLRPMIQHVSNRFLEFSEC